MNGSHRSKQGCWTCRLRRKKCDEKHPFCSTCESLMITCYGYGGLKPDWMDNGEREKAMANSIKQIVKKTSRHKGRLGLSIGRFQGRSQKVDVVKIAPKLTDAGTELSPSSQAHSVEESTPSSGDNRSPGTASDNTAGKTPSSTLDVAEEIPAAFLSSLSAIQGDEAVLLMHFIDTVFPLQYPMYRPTVFEGGRGWLLSLLLRTKPLYHASLALSAYHRGAVLYSASYRGCSTASTVHKEKHLAICLSEFQRAIKDASSWVNKMTCPSAGLGLLACVIQLIFFELFAGHGDAWQIHLRASTDLFCQRYWRQAKELGLTGTPDRLFEEVSTLVIQEGLSSPEDAGIFTFLSGVIIWLDVVSCITSGKSPRLLSFHQHAVSCSSAIKLENIIGVKNWAIFLIGRIAALHENRTQAMQQGHFDAMEFERRTNEIKQELEHALAEYSLASLEIPSLSNYASSVEPALNPDINIITRVFTLAASIYLYLVVHGYQLEVGGVSSIIGEAMMILRTKMPAHLMNAIICPLFIIGSVAKDEDKQFFRRALSSAPVQDPSLEHRGKILPLMEEIWRTRVTAMTAWSWEDTVRLSGRNLVLI